MGWRKWKVQTLVKEMGRGGGERGGREGERERFVSRMWRGYSRKWRAVVK